MARIAVGSFALLAVLLIGGSLPPVSSAGSVGHGRLYVPLRVTDPASYREEKATAEHRFELWRQRRGLAPLTPAPTPRTVVSGGLNASGITDASTTGSPSDSTGAIGPSNYVEFINSEIAVYSNTDLSAPVQGPVDESSFVGDPSASTCDVQVQWDQQGQRWLYAALDCGENAGTNSEKFYFGWSKGVSPDLSASNWCRYQVSTGNNIEDYPKLGHDDSQIIIGTNEFDDNSLNYLQSNIWVFDKPSPGDTNCPTDTAENVTTTTPIKVGDNGGGAFTPVPANIADSSTAGYVVATNQDQAHLDLYAIGHDGGGNNVLLSTTSVTVPTFGLPANVPQPGTPDEIDSSDTRLTQAVAVTDPATGHEGIWTQHTIAGAGGGPAVVRWYELTPGTSTPRQVGTVSGPNGSFAFNGAISPTRDGTSAAIFYNSGSSTRLVDVRVQDRRSDTPSGTSVEDLLLATSVDIDNDFTCPSWGLFGTAPCRWGDYAGASPDPGNACLVWGTSMLTVDPLDGFGTPQWGTRNAAINVCAFTLSVAKAGAGSGTVASDLTGISCGAACSHAYAVGTSVALTATPGTGSTFSGWSGACSGTGTCTVSMSQARAVTAAFSLLPETLTVTRSGSGSGTVSSNPAGVACGAACSFAYPFGTSVTLTATPASGSVFSGWSGACSGSGTCAVAMSGAQSVHASFAKKLACIVPKLKGKKLRAAKRALRKAHCQTGKITRKYSKVRRGRVISERPRPGKHLPVGAKVKLAVSKGKKP
jgi:hypothetical protein